MDVMITVQDHLEPRVMRSSLVVEEGEPAIFHPKAIIQAPDGIEVREHVLEVRARVMSRPEPGFLLKDARHLGVIPPFDTGFGWHRIPSARTLADILREVVDHGLENPKHGTHCSCMDAWVYELVPHVIRNIPDSDWEAQFNARLRIGHVLRLVGGHL